MPTHTRSWLSCLRPVFCFACTRLSRQGLAHQAALRQVTSRAAQRCRQLKVSVFQRWRLATAAAAVERLRRQERAGSIGRGAVVAEAALRRRDAGRVLAGFRRWREVDEEVRRASDPGVARAGE